MFDIMDNHSEPLRFDKSLDDRYYNILKRCYSVDNKDYKNYGARGITMCNEWKHNKKAFFVWCLGNGYSKELEIDRIDNNEGYSPLNCRFVTRTENRNNRSDSPRNLWLKKMFGWLDGLR